MQTDLPALLASLKLNSIQDLLLSDQLNFDNLANSRSIHPLKLQSILAQIHSCVSQSPPPHSLPSLHLSDMWKDWTVVKGDQKAYWSIDGGITQVIGRSNSGKSFLLNQLTVKLLQKGQRVVYLDSCHNYQSLAYRISQQIEKETIDAAQVGLNRIAFRSLADLSAILHCLGQQLAQTNTVVVIDSMPRSEQSEGEIQSGSVQFKIGDKFKKLLCEVGRRVGAVMYASKCGNANTLFDNIYRDQKHRPKWVGISAKQWDSIADSTICVDYGRTRDGKQHWKILQTKQTQPHLLHLTR